jgi:hypothetical protein
MGTDLARSLNTKISIGLKRNESRGKTGKEKRMNPKKTSFSVP